MGCDIHLYVERKVGETWESADKWTPSQYSDEKGRLCVEYEDRFYHDRCYRLFSVLADVRNGEGFAGCDTGDRFNPIADPRGIPADACKQIKEQSDYEGSDGHSHSWFTVAELLAYDWTQVATLRGWVSGPVLAEWERYGRKQGQSPEEWSGGISGPSIEHVSEQELLRRIKVIQNECGNQYREADAAIKSRLSRFYCLSEWKTPYHRCCKEFWSETIPRLLRLGKPDDVRIVFWFDN